MVRACVCVQGHVMEECVEKVFGQAPVGWYMAGVLGWTNLFSSWPQSSVAVFAQHHLFPHSEWLKIRKSNK